MDQTLLLNASFEPLQVIPWQKAVTLLWQGKVEVVEFHDREVRGVSVTIRLPSVLRLLRFIRPSSERRPVRLSRANLFARDRFQCQYCGTRHSSNDLTFDHVVPVSRGGRKTWGNIVTSCVPCNRRKGGRTPEEARMRLVRPPRKPLWAPVLTIRFGLGNAPVSWRDYLHWTLEFEAERSL